MKNVKMLHDRSPDVCINDIQFARWCIGSIYKLTITLMYVVYLSLLAYLEYSVLFFTYIVRVSYFVYSGF